MVEQILPNAVKQAYVYNAADQLTGIGWADKDDQVIGSLGYGYHPQSGRLSAQTGSYAPQLLPPASQGDNTFDANHRQTRFEGTALHYDANGNLTEAGGRRYVWNARNQLVEVREGTQLVASYRYDALGRRIAKQENGGTIEYLYDGLNPIQEKAGETINPILTGLGVDEYYARNEAIGRTYFLSDHQNSTRALTNAAGQVVNRYDYDPYGNVQQSKTGFSNPYQYTGRERDQTGLMYYRARYYRPDMGRFIAEDPIGLAGGLNTYVYVEGNPLMYADHLGLAVYLCSRPVNVDWVPMSMRPYLRHMWVKTSTTEARMAGECPVPGQGCADVPYSATKNKSHAGQSALSGSICVFQQNVDEACVNSKINQGQPTGTWSMVNQYQSFSNAVVAQCRYGPQDGPLVPNALHSRDPLGSRFSPKP
ncbi:RHS repeat domain-containing protein [Solilutibacter pythonis]|uniref:RHS repeat domain-containing protein n=1 Tax=Solilutibacter pythonis TaxID=2483112 RepID=UPI0011C3F134|nr:RHS repeat-associated core domain-containing protein [Lysobacter pythonis]